MLAVLALKIDGADWSAVDLRWGRATVAWLAVAIAAQSMALGFQAARWGAVLTGIGQPVPWRRLLRHTFAGQFVSNVLPTTFGGDALRVARSGHDIGSHPNAFAAVAIERLAGWLVLPLLSLVGFVMSGSTGRFGRSAPAAAAIGAGTIVALVAILALAYTDRAGRWSDKDGWRGYIGAVHLGLRLLRRRPAALFSIVLNGLAFQAALCVATWALGQMLGLHRFDLAASVALFPVVAIVQNLPVGIGGLGVREGAFVYLLSPLGIPRASSIALGLSVFALTVVVSALGAPAFAAVQKRGLDGSDRT